MQLAAGGFGNSLKRNGMAGWGEENYDEQAQRLAFQRTVNRRLALFDAIQPELTKVFEEGNDAPNPRRFDWSLALNDALEIARRRQPDLSAEMILPYFVLANTSLPQLTFESFGQAKAILHDQVALLTYESHFFEALVNLKRNVRPSMTYYQYFAAAEWAGAEMPLPRGSEETEKESLFALSQRFSQIPARDLENQPLTNHEPPVNPDAPLERRRQQKALEAAAHLIQRESIPLPIRNSVRFHLSILNQFRIPPSRFFARLVLDMPIFYPER
jgi:hypothetical protein